MQYVEYWHEHDQNRHVLENDEPLNKIFDSIKEVKYQWSVNKLQHRGSEI